MDEHKSVKSFGQASLVLNCVEFSWLRWFHDGKCCPRGKDSANIFHTFRGCRLTKPAHFLHLAWTDAGLKGPVSFNLIRSSVATQAERHLSETERRKVARAMCHDPGTAERFYVALPTRESAYENRRLRMKALMCEKRKAKAKRKSKVCDEEQASYSLSSESSEDGDEPVYDDEPESSSLSSSSSEELSIRRQRRSLLKRKLYGPVPSTSPKQKPEATVAVARPSQIQVLLERVDENCQQRLKEVSIVLNMSRESNGRPPSCQLQATDGVLTTPSKLRSPEASPSYLEGEAEAADAEVVEAVEALEALEAAAAEVVQAAEAEVVQAAEAEVIEASEAEIAEAEATEAKAAEAEAAKADAAEAAEAEAPEATEAEDTEAEAKEAEEVKVVGRGRGRRGHRGRRGR